MCSILQFSSRTASVIVLSSAIAALTAMGCASGDPMTGSWVDADATTMLPEVVGGGILDVNATFFFDGDVDPGTFDMHLELSFSGASDIVDAHGTYATNGADLALTFAGFDVDPASGNEASISEDGAQCVRLAGFGSVPVCFPTPQTNGYAMAGDSLSITIDQSIAGAVVSQTELALTRVP